MTVKEQIQALVSVIKQSFEAVPAPAPAPVPAPTSVTMNKYMLADGTEIEVEELEVGKPVMVGGSPAPEGKHTLQDGTVISVDAAGIITEVVAPAAPAMPTGMSKEEVEAIATQSFSKQSQAFAGKDELKAISDKLEVSEKRNKQLFELVEKLAEASITTPAAATPAAFNKQGFDASTIVSQLKSMK